MAIESTTAADAKKLDVEIIFKTVIRTLAAEAGLLDAAERHNLGDDQRPVDVNHAEFEDGRDPENAPKVAGVEVACNPALRIVCPICSAPIYDARLRPRNLRMAPAIS